MRYRRRWIVAMVAQKSGERNRSPTHQYFMRLRLKNIVLRDPYTVWETV